MELASRDLRLYRGLLLVAGGVYLIWWFVVEATLPNAFNPIAGRAVVVGWLVGSVLASLVNLAARKHLRLLWVAGVWLLTAHYFYLFANNVADINWIVGAFITVSAVSLGLLSRATLLAYSLFVVGLSAVMAVLTPALRESVLLPGIITVLLQANVGMQSRLKVIKNLKASNSRFRQLFDSTFEGVIIHEQGRAVQVNVAALSMLGLSANEVLGQRVSELIHPDDRALLGEDLGGPEPQQVRGLKRDGSTIELEVRGKPFSHDARFFTLKDVSERERQAAALQKANEALERSNIDLQRFAFIASHDLQTPLRGIGSFVGLLQSTYGPTLDARANDWLARTQLAVKQLQTLIQDLLEYSRLETNARPMETVEMTEVLERANDLLTEAITSSSAEVTHGPLPLVSGDRSQLVQLLMNLVGNALKYHGPEAPRVHVTAEPTDEGWRFSVKDNGIGIDARHHQKIFEIFKRLHDSKEYPGTGIGLAVCRRVVDRHGGTLWVESAVGSGSTFSFTLPRSPVDEQR